MKLQIEQQFTEDWKQELAGQAVTKCIADWKAQTAGESHGPSNVFHLHFTETALNLCRV